jgi:hypothetical protein
MKKLAALLSFAGTAAIADVAPAPPTSGLCPQALKAVPAMTQCRETAAGAIIGTDAAAVQAAAIGAGEGEARFRVYFNRAVPSYVVSFTTDPAIFGPLREAGFKIVQPWLDAQTKAAAMDQSLRRGVLKAVEGKNMTPEQIDALVEQARSKLPQVSAVKDQDNDTSALAHELGHQWFMEAFWPSRKVGKSGHYGGPAPDWMDELAAVLHESDQMAADRRRQFGAVYLQQPSRKFLADVEADEITNLETFLTREHPANRGARAAVERMKQETGKSSGVLVMTGAEAEALSRDGVMFYLQSRVFADFVIERTGNARVFAEIAAADAQGLKFPAWLAKNGRRLNLASSVAQLQKQWEAWLEVKFRAEARGTGEACTPGAELRYALKSL